MAEFRCSSLGDLLNEWARPDAGPLALMDADVEGTMPGLPGDVDMCAAHQTWMPFCMTVLGMLHVSHNASKDMDLTLAELTEFYSQLQNCMGLLGNAGRRRRVAALCVQGTHLDHLTDLFEKDVCKLHEARWNNIIECIESVEPLLMCPRTYWGAAKYGHIEQHTAQAGEQEADSEGFLGQFDTAVFTSTLRSSKFFAYMRMLLALHECSRRVGAWAEGCACHEHMATQRKGPQRHSSHI